LTHAPAAGASVVGSAVHLNGFDASKFNSENGAAFWPVWQASHATTYMAKLTHFNSKTICGAEPNFSFGLQFFSIGLSSKQSQVTYHLHPTP
jgi:hypothetical protein